LQNNNPQISNNLQRNYTDHSNNIATSKDVAIFQQYCNNIANVAAILLPTFMLYGEVLRIGLPYKKFLQKEDPT